MRPLLDILKVAPKLRGNALSFSSHLKQGNKYSFEVEVDWKRPPKYPVYHPECSGDLEPLPDLEKITPYGLFRKSKEIETADANVKNIFSLKYQTPANLLRYYRNKLTDEVKNHQYDYISREVKIASLTATVRFLTKQIEKAKNRRIRRPLIRKYSHNLKERQKQLEELREEDYKKFEWILEQLNIVYRPTIPREEQQRTRKKSLMKLVQLRQEKLKEENLAKLKESLDNQKIPFLEKKLQKLKWVKEMEEKHNFPKTVSENDIENCMKKLEEVKIEIQKKKELGYERKIHPYTIEPYFDKLLKKKEKAGELLREPGPETERGSDEAK